MLVVGVVLVVVVVVVVVGCCWLLLLLLLLWLLVVGCWLLVLLLLLLLLWLLLLLFLFLFLFLFFVNYVFISFLSPSKSLIHQCFSGGRVDGEHLAGTVLPGRPNTALVDDVKPRRWVS